ncbi:right-handed parallel beta-helix repeat-containing protein [Massilia sp. HP4]|uniref:right-handed parallel beta-helix repeat-containing protein n=1 Tax=Massilia sp. HP4 TaxID=2562316 RepID=UPI001E4CCD31|nr:right-handed parallel beta-helix repeat-containing protein [Massilia sp. HP4]
MKLAAGLLLAGGLLGLAGAGAALWVLDAQGVTPRTLGPYLQFRASGHNTIIEESGRLANAVLTRLDRGDPRAALLPPLVIGAQPQAAPAPHGGRTVLVASADEAQRAVRTAAPGDVITFVPGDYRIAGRLYAARPGTEQAPIVVRAPEPGSVRIAFASAEGFSVSAPYWRFENLDIRGACRHNACEHAFHVVGNAHHFVARNNTIRDFNAHFKINGEKGRFPDHGLLESNTLGNDAPRPTNRAVTPIDLVGASDWIIRANLVSDFIKADGDRISYGIFAKGGAQRTVIERNLVVCEQRLRGQPGQRVGLSFGGGGTGRRYCRDGRCITEHDDGLMRANLVLACSDAGIHLNSAAGSRLVDNTLLDTAGVQVRFPESMALMDGNLVDGPIREDDGGAVRATPHNRSTAIGWLYAGRHPQRALFSDPAAYDLRWRGEPPRRAQDAALPDLCGKVRGAAAAFGAFDDFAHCLRGDERERPGGS